MNGDISRRSVLGAGGRLIAAGATASIGSTVLGSATSAAATRTTAQIVDIATGPYFDQNTCSQPKDAFYKSLVSNGVKTIIRYYSGITPGEPINNGGLACKNITREERAIIHAHGLSLAVVYQYEGRTPGRYSAETGTRDAKFCIERAKYLKQPEGSPIYFGIDSNTSDHPIDGVKRYLEKVREEFKGRYQIGCYGPGAVCAAVAPDIAKYTWIPESPAWEGTRDYMNKGNWTFYQNKSNVDLSTWTKPFAVRIDTNFLNPKFNTIGAFNKDGSIARYDKSEVARIAAKRMWVTAGQLPILDRPDGAPKGHMCIARIVHVVGEIKNGWAAIDINEDGQVDGYCTATGLSPLSKMPEWHGPCVPMDY